MTGNERMARIGRAEAEPGLNRTITPQETHRSVVIRVPGCPPSLNKILRMHWATRKKLLEAWSSDLWYSASCLGRSATLSGWARSRARLTVNICLQHNRLFDKDNAYGSVKVVLDAMKSLGFIADDSPEFIDLEVTQEKSRTVETVITIWEP